MSDDKRNYRQELTDKIIDLMERGEAPWQKPWDGEGRPLDMPYNPVSGTQYRGSNAMWLMMKGMGEGYEDPRWMTYKQAASIGAQVRKGEKSTLVEYWKWHDEKKEKDPATGEEKTVRTKLDPPRVFFANVFNASQIDGLPPLEKSHKHDPDWNPVAAAERILQNSGADIRHDQTSRAFYRRGTDSIHLPERGRFATEMDYYEVAMHELGHWTGHESRLGRDLKGPFGSPEYAREELRAQMASLFVSAELGIPFHPERHAAYNKSWIEVLKEDKHEFFRASREAEKIADYVLDFNREIEVEKVQEKDMKQSIEVGSQQSDGGWAFGYQNERDAALRVDEWAPGAHQKTPEQIAAEKESARIELESQEWGHLDATQKQQKADYERDGYLMINDSVGNYHQGKVLGSLEGHYPNIEGVLVGVDQKARGLWIQEEGRDHLTYVVAPDKLSFSNWEKAFVDKQNRETLHGDLYAAEMMKELGGSKIKLELLNGNDDKLLVITKFDDREAMGQKLFIGGRTERAVDTVLSNYAASDQTLALINAKREKREAPTLTEAEGLAQTIDKSLKVERATDDAMTYTGAIVGETGGDVLVKVGDNRTIAMSKARMEADPEVGNRGTVGYQQKTQDRAADQAREKEALLIGLGGKSYALQRADEVIADEGRKTFTGRILGIQDGEALMAFGRDGNGQERVVAHDVSRLPQQPQAGQMVEINYSQPQQVLMKNLSRGEERSQGKGLGIA